jgi:hypothetical protein
MATSEMCRRQVELIDIGIAAMNPGNDRARVPSYDYRTARPLGFHQLLLQALEPTRDLLVPARLA